jgi:hypothetical protein
MVPAFACDTILAYLGGTQRQGAEIAARVDPVGLILETGLPTKTPRLAPCFTL